MLSRERNLTVDDINRMSTWSSLMLEADEVLSASAHELLAARTAHRDRMKKLHEAARKLPADDKNQTARRSTPRKSFKRLSSC